MINALIKRVSVTYKCYEMYAHQGKIVQLLVFWGNSQHNWFPVYKVWWIISSIAISDNLQCWREWPRNVHLPCHKHRRNRSKFTGFLGCCWKYVFLFMSKMLNTLILNLFYKKNVFMKGVLRVSTGLVPIWRVQ
jgi:hypothetical protein